MSSEDPEADANGSTVESYQDEYGNDVVVDETAFFKQLQSDVADDVSLKLLTDVYETNEIWRDFQEEDIAQVVEVFSILNMAPGEKLITKGEYATFCGIVLQGTFNAIVTPTFTVPLRAGDMVGEMALFEGGARNADIITGTDPEGCILAVITFVDLDTLAQNERYSQLARKLTMMFATASIRKLRGMIKPAGPPAAPATSTDGTGTDSATTAPTGDAATASATAPATAEAGPTEAPAADAAAPLSSPALRAAAEAGVAVPAASIAGAGEGGEAPVKKPRVKKEEKKVVVAETLYKNKMSKAADAAASAAAVKPSNASAESSAVPQPKNLAEAQTYLEDQHTKLRKAEHHKRNQNVMLDKMKKKIQAHEETIRQHEETIAKLTGNLKSTTEALAALNTRFDGQAIVLQETLQALEKEKKAAADTAAQLTLSAEGDTKRLGEELAQLRTEMDQLGAAKRATEDELAREKADLAALTQAKADDATRATTVQLELTQANERLAKELTSKSLKADALEADLAKLSKHAEEQRLSLASMNMRILDLEEKLSAAMSWKLKALEFQSGLDAEKKRHVRLSDDWTKQSKELETELKHYKLLLKTFAITIYAKEFRLRKAIGVLHKRVSEMLLTTLEEHYNTSTGKEKSIKGSSVMSASNTAGGVGGMNSSTNAGASPASITSTFKTVRKRKKAYLDSLLKPTSKLRDVVTSLDDEVSKLKGPFEELRERAAHWRATSESFFQRNIDLASKLMTLDRSLHDSTSTTGKDAVTMRNQQQVAKDAQDSKAKQQQQQQEATLSARSGAVGATPQSGEPTKESTTTGSNATASGGKTASAKAELELLEARATVLRVHVQQLEQHYLQLQAAIHNAAGHQQLLAQQIPVPQPPIGSSATQQFQESKQDGGAEQPRFDPSLVSPVPFPQHGPAHPYMLAQQQQQQQQAMMSPRTANQTLSRGGAGVSGNALQFQSPSSYGPYAAIGGAGRFYPTSAHVHAQSSPPTSQKPDAMSLRQLREQSAVNAANKQSAASATPMLPAVPGAYPPPPSFLYPPAYQQPIVIATPHRTNISFSPRPAVPSASNAPSTQ